MLCCVVLVIVRVVLVSMESTYYFDIDDSNVVADLAKYNPFEEPKEEQSSKKGEKRGKVFNKLIYLKEAWFYSSDFHEFTVRIFGEEDQQQQDSSKKSKDNFSARFLMQAVDPLLWEKIEKIASYYCEGIENYVKKQGKYSTVHSFMKETAIYGKEVRFRFHELKKKETEEGNNNEPLRVNFFVDFLMDESTTPVTMVVEDTALWQGGQLPVSKLKDIFNGYRLNCQIGFKISCAYSNNIIGVIPTIMKLRIKEASEMRAMLSKKVEGIPFDTSNTKKKGTPSAVVNGAVKRKLQAAADSPAKVLLKRALKAGGKQEASTAVTPSDPRLKRLTTALANRSDDDEQDQQMVSDFNTDDDAIFYLQEGEEEESQDILFQPQLQQRFRR